MRAIKQKFHGKLYRHHDQTVLLLESEATAPPVYLRYALTQMGTEAPLFPASLLDDWGNEIKKLKLYQWVRQNGNAFPRAEVFGFDRDGRETQRFLRELELYARYPCYAYLSAKAPVNEGWLLNRIMVPTPGVVTPQSMKRPDELSGPIRRAQVSWWQVDGAELASSGYRPVEVSH